MLQISLARNHLSGGWSEVGVREVTEVCNHCGDNGGEVSSLSVQGTDQNRFNAFLVDGEVRKREHPAHCE